MEKTKLFSYESKNAKKIANNTNRTDSPYSVDSRNVSIYESNPDKTYSISIHKFVDILNSVATSKNALDICNSIGCMDPKIRSYALQYGLTYKNIFSCNDKTDCGKHILKLIETTDKPQFNNKIFKTITIIKWKLYDFKKNNNYNQLCGEWIGVLAGLILYFDELDENAFNKTQYSKEICRNITIDDL